MAWATSAWDRQLELWTTLSCFTPESSKTSNHLVQGSEAAKHLLPLCQGTHSVAEYSVEFRKLVGFLNGLNERVKDELALGDEVDSFHSLMTLDIRLDNQK